MARWNPFSRRPAASSAVGAIGAVARWEDAGPRAQAGQRTWLAAQPSRLLADLPGAYMRAPNADIRWALAYLRNRSRWLAQNDGFTRGYLGTLRRNVVGPGGFTLQMAVKNEKGDGEDANANKRIEAAWAEWAPACEVTGKLTFTDLCHAAIMGVPRDGEVIFRKVRGGGFNRSGFALQVIDPARLDETCNGRPNIAGFSVAGDNLVRAGVELTPWGRPAAYWLRTYTPNDDPLVPVPKRLERVPADDIIHLFVHEWPDQIRGVPWLSASIRTLAMLDGYSEAELTAARVSAGKMGFYKQGEVEDVPAELQNDGSLVQESTAGSFELLPKGVSFESYDPQHPNTAFGAFVAAQQRQAAAGAGLSYAAFANDPGSLNYSGLRHVALEDRDEYRTLQNWMINNFCLRFFPEWLTETLVAGVTGLPPGKFWKFNAPRFIGRGWDWVDPQNEIKAAREAVALGIKSRTQIVAEKGGDFAAVIADLEREQAAMANLIPPPDLVDENLTPADATAKPQAGASGA
jgi:lambda family phage portal protein